MTIIIKVDKLSKSYGERIILKDVSFKVKKGEIFGIIGMSGSGKTTLLNTVIGFFRPEEGSIKYCPPYMLDEVNPEFRKIENNLEEVKRTFGFAPQTPSFYPKLSVEENLMLFGSFYDIDETILKRNISHLLKLTKLYNHRKKISEELSGGMQRRLNIICGMVHKPYLLILDEPTADLDPILREETWELIKEINRMGTTVIVASHLLEELEKYSDSVAILHEGKITEYGSLEKIQANYAKNTREIKILVNNPKIITKALKRNKHIKNIIVSDNRLTIFIKDPYKTLVKIIKILEKSKEKIRLLEVREPSLREIFGSIENE